MVGGKVRSLDRVEQFTRQKNDHHPGLTPGLQNSAYYNEQKIPRESAGFFYCFFLCQCGGGPKVRVLVDECNPLNLVTRQIAEV